MSTRTKNFDLIKPSLTDPADITAMNTNWDKIDDELLKSKEVFIAEYEVTPPEEVMNAINDGKFVYCRKDSHIMPLSFNRADMIMFSSMHGYNMTGGYFTEAWVDTGTLLGTPPKWSFRKKELSEMAYVATTEDLVDGESQVLDGYLYLVYE